MTPARPKPTFGRYCGKSYVVLCKYAPWLLLKASAFYFTDLKAAQLKFDALVCNFGVEIVQMYEVTPKRKWMSVSRYRDPKLDTEEEELRTVLEAQAEAAINEEIRLEESRETKIGHHYFDRY